MRKHTPFHELRCKITTFSWINQIFFVLLQKIIVNCKKIWIKDSKNRSIPSLPWVWPSSFWAFCCLRQASPLTSRTTSCCLQVCSSSWLALPDLSIRWRRDKKRNLDMMFQIRRFRNERKRDRFSANLSLFSFSIDNFLLLYTVYSFSINPYS